VVKSCYFRCVGVTVLDKTRILKSLFFASDSTSLIIDINMPFSGAFSSHSIIGYSDYSSNLHLQFNIR
ncbi:hypothetical protein BpHYR1_048592, partial [Brachionus plicatilis]